MCEARTGVSRNIGSVLQLSNIKGLSLVYRDRLPSIARSSWSCGTCTSRERRVHQDTSRTSTFLAAGTLRKVPAHAMPPKRKAAAGRKRPAAAAAAADSPAAQRQKKAEPVASEETTEVNVYVFDARWQS